jgi:hypothetical protein
MFDSLFSYIIILIPIAIFIFRIVSNFRKQDDAPLRPASGAGYEDEDDDDDEKMPFPAATTEKARFVPVPVPALSPVVPVSQPAPREESPSLRKAKDSGTLHAKTEQARGFPYNLDYLVPLKRGVVLSEILGPPRGF